MLKELQKYLKDKPKLLFFGTKQTIKQVKLDKIKEVFLAKDCYEEIKERIENYAKFSKMQVKNLEQNKDELALICKKSFPISIISVLKE
ncbi:hypothetical protein B6U80_02030 [Candidatus Pacearchaeota archaeon ex4484_26]|nr:MAG: hypothetical protein B6U80_02030 [Candidatus Pacearchaeota archaeon ex4484_26]